MKNIQRFICAVTLGLLVQAQGAVVFHDTFQAGNDTAPNIDYALRQTSGLVTTSYNLTIDGSRVDNGHRILDRDSDGESALALKVFKPLGGVGSTSWTASRTAVNFSSYLDGSKYAIKLDSQFVNAGGDPSGFDTAFAVGILASAGATTTPMTAASLFGIRLNGTGGGFGIYTNGTLAFDFAEGSTLVWQERFGLELVVDEVNSTVQVLLQGIGDASATNLGTYAVNFASDPNRIIQLYGSQTDNNSGLGGALAIDTFEMDISTLPVFATAYDAWSNSYALVEGPAGDDDSDGLANLYEYGLGGDPTNALDQGTSPGFGIVDVGGTNYFGYVHPQLADPSSGLNYFLELNTELVSGVWTNAGYVVLGTNVTGNALDFVTNVTDTVDGQKFIRLIIE